MKRLVPTLFALTLASLVPAVHADDAHPHKLKFNIPPSAELSYVIRARQSGFPIDGNAMVHWSVSGKRYSVTNEARAPLFGKVLDSKSEGEIDEYGLAPQVFAEKRFRRDATTTSFDRDAHIIRFSIGDQTYPIKGGEQDRNSAIWQLISVARATPSRFKPGSEWTFFVAGQRDADPWTFKVVSQEKLDTPLGEVTTLHIVKAPPPDSKDQQVDIWLGPHQEWYPIRLRYTDADGDFIEQTLEQIRHQQAVNR
jgi:hypothetical protein